MDIVVLLYLISYFIEINILCKCLLGGDPLNRSRDCHDWVNRIPESSGTISFLLLIFVQGL